MTVAGMSWLIWIRGLRGPEPQIVSGDAGGPSLPSHMKGKHSGVVLIQHRLDAREAGLSLSALECTYPAPKVADAP